MYIACTHIHTRTAHTIIPAGVPEGNDLSGAQAEEQRETGLPGAGGIDCGPLWTVENWKMTEGLIVVDYNLCRMVVLNLSYTLNQPGRSGGGGGNLDSAPPKKL